MSMNRIFHFADAGGAIAVMFGIEPVTATLLIAGGFLLIEAFRGNGS